MTKRLLIVRNQTLPTLLSHVNLFFSVVILKRDDVSLIKVVIDILEALSSAQVFDQCLNLHHTFGPGSLLILGHLIFLHDMILVLLHPLQEITARDLIPHVSAHGALRSAFLVGVIGRIRRVSSKGGQAHCQSLR
jgi:hypothetical protein